VENSSIVLINYIFFLFVLLFHWLYFTHCYSLITWH